MYSQGCYCFTRRSDFGIVKHNFGNGPVAAHQHLNGGGWVADTARVDDTAYVSGEVFDQAYVGDYAQIYGKVGEHAQVYDFAIVFMSGGVYGYVEVFDRMIVDKIYYCDLPKNQ